MAREEQDDSEPEFVPMHGGLTSRLAHRLGLSQPPGYRRVLRIVLLILFAWLPVVLMAFLLRPANLTGVTLWRDPEFHARFLLAVPLLDLGEVFLLAMLTRQVRRLQNSGLVAAPDRANFEGVLERLSSWYESIFAEGTFLVLAFSSALITRWGVVVPISSWERHAGNLTPAGWWHTLVSLPILYFYVLKFLWIFLLWSVFLVRLSRLNLQLTATHPDRAGGLGFLSSTVLGFAPSILACSTITSAGFAYEIYHHGESIATLKYHLMVYVAVTVVVIHLPLVCFITRLWRTRTRGLTEYGHLVQRHDRQFEEKWLPNSKTSPVGSPDFLTLAAVADPYEHISRMRCLPLDRVSVISLVLATLLPMLPLIGTEIPLQEIVMKLTEFLM